MKLLKYEHRTEPLLPLRAFLRRLGRTLSFVGVILGVSLGVGICGYHWLQGLGWLDSLLNASMILSGMGPVNPPTNAAGKWFGSFYALFSGIAFITSAGIGFTPVAHRLLHWFHLEARKQEDDGEDDTAGGEPGVRPRPARRGKR